jgi:gamma-glutamylputrescine oxidase
MTKGNDPGEGYPPSYYAATRVPGPSTARLAGEHRTDVCIVGGGYTGLSVALHLARAGVRVMLLEQSYLGWGASGRNGGQIHVGMRRGQTWLEERVGPDDAMNLWRVALDARDHLDWLLAQYRIDCDLSEGLLHLDHRRRYVADSRRKVELLQTRYGYEHISFVDRDAARFLVASDGYWGGTLDRRGGHLHALNFALGLARAAQVEGAALFEHARVERIGRSGTQWRLETRMGAVNASHIVLACNGYLRGLCPPVEARVMPINSFIATTVPLGPERAEALIRNRLGVSDSRFVVYYFRITRDWRLLFGGGESYSYRFPADIGAVVRPNMLRIFPQIADVPIDTAWGGTLAITPFRTPYVRQVEAGLYNLSGYSGMGVVLAPYFGKLVAQAIVRGDADFERLTRLPVPYFPGGRWLRWPTLVAAMSIAALRDRL